jgi:hypothetical protein
LWLKSDNVSLPFDFLNNRSFFWHKYLGWKQIWSWFRDVKIFFLKVFICFI